MNIHAVRRHALAAALTLALLPAAALAQAGTAQATQSDEQIRSRLNQLEREIDELKAQLGHKAEQTQPARPKQPAEATPTKPTPVVAEQPSPPPSGPAQPVQLNQIVVTASPGAVRKMGTSISVSTLDAVQIQDSGAQGAADLLRDVPGIRAESSGGEGNANVAVRGLPVATGGGKFVQFQIDGMPVLEFGDIAFATPDTFLRPDYNVERLEVVRGGSTSVLASNAPGAVFNFITKTGREKGGNIGLTTGLDFDRKRLDFDYGQPVSNDTRFHIGGFLHEGEGPKTVKFQSEFGGQLMGNITHEIDGGFLRLNFQLLDDRTPVFLPVPVSITGSNSDPKVHSLPGFKLQSGAMQSPFIQRDLAVDANGNPIHTDISDGYHSKVKAIGGEVKFTFQDAWTVHDRFRVAANSGSFTGPFPAEVNTASVLAQEVGGAGATLRYANGPLAGKAVSASQVGGNGLAVRSLLFNVTLPNMDNATNDIQLSRLFDVPGGPLNALVGFYYSHQNVKQDWHWNQYIQTVQGKDSVLLDVIDANGNPVTDHGLEAFGEPVFGNCCVRSYDAHYSMNAPYLSLSWQPGNWRFDAGVRYDYMRAYGSYAGATGTTTLDVNGDGVISVPEQSVPIVNNSAALPIDYRKNHVEWSFGANYLLSSNLALFARGSRGARFNADRLLFGGGINADGNAPQSVAVNEVHQQEAGVKWSTRHTSLFVTGFHATTQETNQDVTSTTNFLVNRQYRSYGVEVESSVVYGGFSMRAGTTYTNSRIVSDQITPADVGNAPQRQAAWVYQISPAYRFAPFSAVGNEFGPITIGSTLIGTSSAFASNPNGLRMPAYVQVNAFGRFDITRRLSLSVNADNVFNAIGITEIDQSPVSLQPNGLNTARSILGRTIYATMHYGFE